MTPIPNLARRAVEVLDLTRLEADRDDTGVRELCLRAASAPVHPAAVCVYPRFIAAARETLNEHDLIGRIRVATVANFPTGQADAQTAAEQTRKAILAGADEVDVVFPWREFLGGNGCIGLELVQRCKAECESRPLKVILETGALGKPDAIRRASELAITGGADFLKTSTGKIPAQATPEAAQVMLETISASSRNVGLKVSGGVRTLDEAALYMNMAARIMGPDWVGPRHFRLGASSLLDALLLEIDRSGRESSTGNRASPDHIA
ncbi:MAG: deoxyribose-phosphate aldolase [Wenzhouxiangellaceae bacterium]|nr:deoxyribose-phosphate aldolase [Wenzhouxiangellaceae bacterium]